MLSQLRARRRLQGQGRGVPQAGVAPAAAFSGASPMPAGMQSPLLTPGLVMPYDYGAKFELRGIIGNTLEDVINISPEGAFVATAIGYGFHEERGRQLEVKNKSEAKDAASAVVLRPDLNSPFLPGGITLENIPPQALIEGFRVNPDLAPAVFGSPSRVPGRADERFMDELLDPGKPDRGVRLSGDFADMILQKVKPPEDIHFFFSIVDSATGRELQDVPSHSLASLGKSNGERPFRQLAQPISFLPRSTVRIQVIEATERAVGDLFIVLYGYKILTASGWPEPVIRSLIASVVRSPTAAGPRERVIPFDYVATFDLTGTTGNLVEYEIPVNVDGGFVATSLGYGLLPEGRDASIQLAAVTRLPDPLRNALFSKSDNTNIDFSKEDWPRDAVVKAFSKLPLRLFSPGALRDGIRIRPGFLRIAFQNNGNLNEKLSFELADMVFERLNRPEDVSFLFTIFDTGSGREMQNMYLNNLAGLGIANGDRPFKGFARPMHFQARSTIRVSVVENFGRGKLHLVFQGFKLLGNPPAGGAQ